MRSSSLLVTLLVAAATVTGCGSDDPGSSARRPQATTAAPPTASAPTPAGGSAAPDGARISIGGDEALVWGDGPYGVVLAHGRAYDAASWSAQAPAIAAQGATVIAVENIEPRAILAAVQKLRADGIDRVALVGGSAGSDAILQLCRQQPDLADQLVLLSPNQVVEGLGDQPKLFLASAQERVADVSRTLAAQAPGDDNVVKILPGKAHAQAILRKDAGGPVLALVLRRLRQ